MAFWVAAKEDSFGVALAQAVLLREPSPLSNMIKLCTVLAGRESGRGLIEGPLLQVHGTEMACVVIIDVWRKALMFFGTPSFAHRIAELPPPKQRCLKRRSFTQRRRTGYVSVPLSELFA